MPENSPPFFAQIFTAIPAKERPSRPMASRMVISVVLMGLAMGTKIPMPMRVAIVTDFRQTRNCCAVSSSAA